MKHSEKLPLILLTLFTGKLLILQTFSYEQALVLLGLAVVAGLFHYISTADQLKVINDELKSIKTQFEDVKKHQDNLTSSVSSLRLASNIKTTQLKF